MKKIKYFSYAYGSDKKEIHVPEDIIQSLLVILASYCWVTSSGISPKDSEDLFSEFFTDMSKQLENVVDTIITTTEWNEGLIYHARHFYIVDATVVDAYSLKRWPVKRISRLIKDLESNDELETEAGYLVTSSGICSIKKSGLHTEIKEFAAFSQTGALGRYVQERVFK